MINAELDEIEYPPEATIGDQWLRAPTSGFRRPPQVHCGPGLQLFLRRGRRYGHDLEDWLEAEKMALPRLADREKRTGEHSDGKENE